ncbi:MAG: FAD-dependent oxidoreductase [Rhizobiaceae bacterium]
MIFQTLADFRAASFTPKVAVIGSGPAGISIARKLAAAGVPVVIFEAGGADFTEDSQAFYAGKTVGDYYFDLDITRLRYFGGSSNHWAGWCRVMDDIDFRPKSWVPDSGWPIRRIDIDPYLDEVHYILDLKQFQPDQPISDDIRWVELVKSPAVRFAERFRGEIETSDHIALVLNTYVRSLDGNGTEVTGLNLWSDGADQGTYKADYYVPCTGGLENSRLLLWSNELTKGAVVPHAQALGRYWMEHPQFEGGNAILADQNEFVTDATGEAFFSPTLAAMERRQILNFGIRLIKMPYEGAKALVANLACVAPDTAEWVSESLGQRLHCAAQLYVGWEQSPNENNRVELSKTEFDATGAPRIELHWKKGDIERRTVTEGIRLFGETMLAKNLGRAKLADWLAKGEDYPTDQEIAGHHHMGGTRMHDDPAKGIVDRDCKVHGMRNLYIGGSSVFTTSGQCNPTTTIVALACRLGDHLAREVRAHQLVGAPSSIAEDLH